MSEEEAPQEQPNGQGPALRTIPMAYLCPPGFEPAAFMIIAIDKQGKHFTNAPPQPAVALHLATLALNYVSQRAVQTLQHHERERSPIVTAPAGIIPPWPGPTGRS